MTSCKNSTTKNNKEPTTTKKATLRCLRKTATKTERRPRPEKQPRMRLALQRTNERANDAKQKEESTNPIQSIWDLSLLLPPPTDDMTT
mmetsp:Transcript_9250/g.30075  ORF Transcript_9250/g.30075 Transcript_9250/m.30075 type:complete len:89 (+) Transcript_9250:512-778(+)